MSIDITTLTHPLRQALANDGIEISLGHTHQLLAGALGYKSLASLQAADDEPETFEPVLYWIVHTEQLKSRADSLALSIDIAGFVGNLAAVARDLHGTEVYSTLAELEETIGIEAQDVAADDDKVGTQMAQTNCTGPFISYLEPSQPLTEGLPSSSEEILLQFEGNVQGDHDEDRPFSGDAVDVKVEARLPMLGRRLSGAPSFEVTEAKLDWSWAAGSSPDDEDEPRFSRAEALARELDISLHEAEALDDAEIHPHETSAGAHIGYLVDVRNCARQDLARKLAKRHGNTQIFVMGTSFDYIRFDPRD